jgi:adenylate cyclase
LTEQVEQLAHHAVRGEVWDRAVTYLHEAGAKAFRRSTYAEAIAYLSQGLELAGRLPPGREQMRQELRMLLALGPALQIGRGFAVAEVERTYARARELSEELGEPIELFQALWGLWLHTAGRGRYEKARPFAEELLAVAERLGDRVLLLEAHHAMSPSTLYSGEPEATRRHSEKGMALYDQEAHGSLASLYGGHDPGVCCRMHSGLALWFLGYPKSALERSRSGLALARDLDHLGSIVNALPFAMILHQLRGEGAIVHELAESIITLSTERGFPQWLLFGKVFATWFQAEQGSSDAAIAQLRGAIADYRATGNEIHVPGFFSLLATLLLRHGAADEGLDVMADALAMADATGARLWDSDYYRLKGELLLARDPTAGQEAEMAFRRATEIARGQNAKSWELRAAVSLGRLWQRQGKHQEAARVLAEIHGWFTEGFDTVDLMEAKSLLDRLSGAST